MTKVTVVGVQPLIGPVFNAYLDEDVVFLSCGHSITLEPHEDDNLSLVGTETECEEPHRHSPTHRSDFSLLTGKPAQHANRKDS